MKCTDDECEGLDWVMGAHSAQDELKTIWVGVFVVFGANLEGGDSEVGKIGAVVSTFDAGSPKSR